jgi:excisionase family DNA binding protein
VAIFDCLYIEVELQVKRAPLLTVREVAEWLNVSSAWVRDHATNRRRPALPAVKLGKSLRFREDQIEDFIHKLSGGMATA